MPRCSNRPIYDLDGGARTFVEIEPIYPDVDRLTELFNSLFKESHNTVLIGGANEPIYVAAKGNNQSSVNIIYFREAMFSSALHEVAHWCLAGPYRRQLDDYGYWYAPDGRSAELQLAFEQVEVRPQALEWIFSEMSGAPFTVSLDNLNGTVTNSARFEENIKRAVGRFWDDGLPSRARIFVDALTLTTSKSACK